VWKAANFAMASPAAKRSAPSTGENKGSKKRQKIKSAKDIPPAQKRAVAIDALPWNEVKLPDMFDDAEGFFGLEEVEGVEIVKEGDNIRFVRSNGQKDRTYAKCS
jgi:ATP-dependent RNA helicase DDX24/MAK5